MLPKISAVWSSYTIPVLLYPNDMWLIPLFKCCSKEHCPYELSPIILTVPLNYNKPVFDLNKHNILTLILLTPFKLHLPYRLEPNSCTVPSIYNTPVCECPRLNDLMSWFLIRLISHCPLLLSPIKWIVLFSNRNPEWSPPIDIFTTFIWGRHLCIKPTI